MLRHLPWYLLVRPARVGDWVGLLSNAHQMAFTGLVLVLAAARRQGRLWDWWRRCVVETRVSAKAGVAYVWSPCMGLSTPMHTHDADACKEPEGLHVRYPNNLRCWHCFRYSITHRTNQGINRITPEATTTSTALAPHGLSVWHERLASPAPPLVTPLPFLPNADRQLPILPTAKRQIQFDATCRHSLKLLWAGGCGGTALLHLGSQLLLPPSRQPDTVSASYVLFACTLPLAAVATLSITDPLIGVSGAWEPVGRTQGAA